MSLAIKHKEFNDILNMCEYRMHQDGLLNLPMKHYFTDGMYIREVFIPKGVWLTSHVHLTDYPYSVSMGKINIATPDGYVTMIAPYTGINIKGTRRVGYALEDTIFTSFHINADNCRDIKEIERRIFKKHNNPLLRKTRVNKMEVIK